MRIERGRAPYTPPEPDEKLGVFVSPSGSKSNPGTRAAPLDSPKDAAVLAERNGKVVYVAAGQYQDQVAASVSLYGGYSPDFTELDPARFLTQITGPPGTHSTTAVTLEKGDIVVHGFTLRGGESKHAAAIAIRTAARARVIRNILLGGGRGPSPDGFTYSHGVNIAFSERPVFMLTDNTIHGGWNQYCWGIDGLREGCVVEGNTIVGGASTSPNSATHGIRAGGGFTLRNNSIDAGSGASATGVTVGGDGATIVGNRFTTRRGNWRDCLVIGGENDLVVSGNTLDGTPDEVCFGFVKKLSRRTWVYNECTGDQWSHDAVTLVPWGWLVFSSDSAIEPTGGGYSGPKQSFHDFLTQGPPGSVTLPDAIAAEVRALLLAAGVE